MAGERWLFKGLGPVEPGDGDPGGEGGIGGRGGAGGNIKLVIHPNAEDILQNIIIDVSGGEGGDGGQGGEGGGGGIPLEGQMAGVAGPNGLTGRKGEKGQKGNSEIVIMMFDPKLYHDSPKINR